jgi:hypothetical protein
MKQAVPYTVLWPGYILWPIVTATIFYFGLPMAYKNHRFAVESKPVMGTVDDRTYSVSRGGRGGTQYSYYIVYHYEVGNLRAFCRTSVHLATWQVLQKAQPIPLKYLADDPASSRIALSPEENGYRISAVATNVGGLISLFGGAGVLRFLYLRNKRYEKLVAQGLTAQGQVTDIRTERRGKSTVTFMVFEFHDGSGKVIEGKTWPLSTSTLNSWEVDNSIRVYYDRQDSSSFTVDVDRSAMKGA